MCTILAAAPCCAQTDPILLPAPRKDGGKLLMRALVERQTARAFSDRALASQMLSDLLWAAFGVNRAKIERGGPGRTAAVDAQCEEILLAADRRAEAYVRYASPPTRQTRA